MTPAAAAGSPDSEARPGGPEEGGLTVTILMGLHNGAPHLSEQLQSIAAQRHADWRLIVSDDGSEDDGPALVRAFADRHPPEGCGWSTGRAGVSRRTTCRCCATCPRRRAGSPLPIRMTSGCPNGCRGGSRRCGRCPGRGRRPGAALRPHADLHGRPPPHPPVAAAPPAAGVPQRAGAEHRGGQHDPAEPAASRLLRAAAPRTAEVVVHDWWAYQLVSGAEGGRILHDDRPALLYRQHGGNLIGANDGLGARLQRLRQLFAGTMRAWTEVNLAALAAAEPWLSAEARETVARLRATRELPGLAARLSAFRRLGLYRQTHADTLALWLVVAIRRL